MELKPCPLCGGGAVLVSQSSSAIIECIDCGCMVGYGHHAYTSHSRELSVVNVVEKWNKRAWPAWPAPVNIRDKVTSK